MTLTISLLVPDGIVLAADSLMTTISGVKGILEVDTICPKCNDKIHINNVSVPPIPIPSGGSPFGQKIFNIGKRNIGILTYGQAFMDGQTIAGHIRKLEKEEIVGEETVESTANKIKSYFDQELKKEPIFNQLPENVYPLGFQISGYDKQDTKIGKNFVVDIGKSSKIRATHLGGYSVTYGGEGVTVSKIWEGGSPDCAHMSLQDAVDYAKFLIRTTSDFQRFSPMVPNVGGPIDVAIITHYSGFRWIERKELNQKIE